MGRRWAAPVLTLSLALAAAGCRAEPPPAAEPSPAAPPPVPTLEPDPEPAERGGTLRYAITEPAAIIPRDAAGAESLPVVSALFDSLTTYGPELDIVPAAAIRWETGEAADEWTFRLRRDATFHDGTPVTAADFKFAWELAVRDGTAGYHLNLVEGYPELAAGVADELAGVTALGDHALQVRLREPFAEFPAVVAHPALAPVPRARWEEDPEAFQERPVGNGPFLAAEAWAQGRFLRLARFDDWRNGPVPALGEVLFQFMDADTGYLAFQQGRIDVAALPAGALRSAIDRYGRSPDGYSGSGVITGPVPVLYFLGFNVEQAPFDDDEVRQAISMAIDRGRIVAEVLEGNVDIARAAVPPAVPGGRARTCAACRHDPDAARDVFEERGIDQITLWFNRDGGHEPIAQRIREDLGAVGVRVVWRTEEFGDYLQALERGEANLYRFGWAPDYPTLDESLHPLFHSQSVPQNGGHNYGRYTDAEVDDLLDQARATLDPRERQSLYQEAEDRIMDEQAIVPIMTYRHRAVASDRIAGFRLNPMGVPDLSSVHLSARTLSSNG